MGNVGNANEFAGIPIFEKMGLWEGEEKYGRWNEMVMADVDVKLWSKRLSVGNCGAFYVISRVPGENNDVL